MKTLIFAVLFILTVHPMSAASYELTFCWDANTDEITGYRLYMKADNNEDYALIWEGEDTCSNLLDSSLERGKGYLFVVRAFNDNGESEDSNAVWYITSEDSETQGQSGSCWIQLLVKENCRLLWHR